ncbi:hypothetical protein MHTCC0001_09730 [Flavobacteriaceae bacterium MHTCC 0001]
MLDFFSSTSGVIMPTFYGLEVHSSKLEAYQTKDLDYKIQARQIVCAELGYEPPIELSVLGELCIRNVLKRFDQGMFSKQSFDEKIEFHIQTIKTVLIEYAQCGSC